MTSGWTLEESRQLFDRYHSKLNPIDKLYERIFRLMRSPRFNLANTGKELSGTVSARINEFTEALRTLSDSSTDIPEAVSARMNDISESLARYRVQLASTGRDLPDVISAHLNEASEVLGKYRVQISRTGREISETVSARINEVNEAMTRLSDLSRKPV